jgi:hypothetical protein
VVVAGLVEADKLAELAGWHVEVVLVFESLVAE